MATPSGPAKGVSAGRAVRRVNGRRSRPNGPCGALKTADTAFRRDNCARTPLLPGKCAEKTSATFSRA